MLTLKTNSIALKGKSPFVYPLYGIGELIQGFSRDYPINGVEMMLSKPVDEIVMEKEKFFGIKSEGIIVKCKAVIGGPSYLPRKAKKVGSVVRIICILDHSIPNTNNADSFQLIIPQNQVGRKHDIYVTAISSAHNICPKGMFVATVSFPLMICRFQRLLRLMTQKENATLE